MAFLCSYKNKFNDNISLNSFAFLHFCALVKESSVLSDSNKHQVVPCDFIGIIKRQQSVILRSKTIVNNHDE
ncbi:hypothetical protein SELMODRAFT_138473 [Selaginella moellendorffii]|uniref:Uncharacterized protein n=1 Tax=Selaginella moellendorffii TaxID=88036 RepID=D8TFF0_SELML|nr:hypothetical protein SELMODRAFT_138473 [Selaginella moellendorffii]